MLGILGSSLLLATLAVTAHAALLPRHLGDECVAERRIARPPQVAHRTPRDMGRAMSHLRRSDICSSNRLSEMSTAMAADRQLKRAADRGQGGFGFGKVVVGVVKRG